MEDEEHSFLRERIYVQTEMDFKNDEDFGELFEKPAKVVLLTKKEVNLQNDRVETKPVTLV
jgi:hypothetical protein